MQEQIAQRKEEMELFARFKKIASTKLEQLTRQSDETGIKLKMGDEEQKILYRQNGMGLKEGVAAGIVTFIVLRKGPIYMSRWLQKRALQQQQAQAHSHATTGAKSPPQSGMNVPPLRGDGSYQLSNPNVSNANNPFQRVQNPEGPPRSKSIVLRSIWFGFDALLSLMVAASVSMTYTDADKLRRELVEIPLVTGRSLVSDTLCDDITAELQKVQQEELPVYLRLQQSLKEQHHHQGGTTNDIPKSPASFYLESIQHFTENCQRRRAMERRIRQEQGLDKRDPVEIPSPGVPRDGPRLVTLTDGNQMEVNKEDVDFDALRQGEDEWASEFVTDQEDANKKW